MKVYVRIEGEKEVLESLDRFGKASRRAALAVVRRKGETMVAAARPLCPVAPKDGGALRDSIRAEVKDGPQGPTVELVAGGTPLLAATVGGDDYAYVVHEDLTLRHTTGQGKFLEIPFTQEAPKTQGELERELDVEAKRATG